MAAVETVELNNGAHLPLLGLGTWQCKDEEELAVALRAALDNGYRLIDTAFLYQNEAFIGKVLKEYISSGKIKREELFITTKLSFTAHAPEDVEKMVEQQLKDLQLDYVDLYLMHCPTPFAHQEGNFLPLLKDGALVPLTISHMDTWKALEILHKQGKLKALGISNFGKKQIQELYDQAEVKPANLQVECHIYWPQFELHELCKKLNISFTAYGPLGSPGRKAARPDGVWPEGDPLQEEVVSRIAANHHKTAAQVLLRHLTQRGMSAIPKSVSPDRIVENISIFDFKLSDDEMKQMDSIENHVRLFVMDFATNHPFFPHEDIDVAGIPKVALKLH